MLYDAWHVLGVAGPVRRVAPVDLVHAPSPAVPPTGAVPLVVTVHDAAPLVMPEAFTRRGVTFHRQGFAAAAKRARLVIAVSEFSADEVAAHTAIPRDRIRVVPNGVDSVPATADAGRRGPTGVRSRRSARTCSGPAPSSPGRTCACCSTRSRTSTRGRVPHRLVLAGPPGWKPDDGDGAVARSLGDRVRLLGPVGRDHLFALFAGADLFAFPSRHEGFGIPVLEAMAQGTAVVCADIPALREVAGERGALRRARRPRRLGRPPSQSLLTDAAARSRLAEAGSARVPRFSWERCARETAAVYREALNG